MPDNSFLGTQYLLLFAQRTSFSFKTSGKIQNHIKVRVDTAAYPNISIIICFLIRCLSRFDTEKYSFLSTFPLILNIMMPFMIFRYHIIALMTIAICQWYLYCICVLHSKYRFVTIPMIKFTSKAAAIVT